MPKPKSAAFTRIRAEVLRLVATIPQGKFSTYGSIAVHMNVSPRHVAFVLARLTPEESAQLPWHRVVARDARISAAMDSALAQRQAERLSAEGMTITPSGHIHAPDPHFHPMGVRREIRWDEQQ
jgi:methylated-DNA-protein-cysteine methyltransferase related protein